MKVAIVHDYIKEYGGAERVLEALHEIYPKAPIYTLVYLPQFLGPHKDRFKNWDIRTSWAQILPFKTKLISPLRLVAPWLFEAIDFSGYDAVIVSSTGAYTPNMIRCKWQMADSKEQKGNHTPSAIRHQPVHICYCHTPPRYLYGYATARAWKNNIVFRILGETANHFLRLVDFKAAQKVDFFIANSKEVKGRIKKFYRKDATVIYPPVEGLSSMNYVARSKNENEENIHTTSYKLPATDYYLAGGRLARPKHVDLIIEAAEKLAVPLKVFGKSFAGFRLQSTQHVEFVGEVSDEQKHELMRGAKAYVFAAEDEDFGITPVEAMMCGTPVIAYESGGVKETVVAGKTGLFFATLDKEAIVSAIKKFETMTFEREEIATYAKKFAKDRFEKEIKAFVAKHTQ